MELFIECVRKEPCLWNPLDHDYRDMTVKDEAWQRVITRCDNKAIQNVSTAKQEWKRLRDNHRDALKRAKLGKNKLLPAQITTWKYAKVMQFLEPHMKYRITEHIEDPPTTISEISKVKSTKELGSSSKDTKDADLLKSKRQRLEHNTQNLSVSMPLREDSDALDSFFKCILQSTRQMPPWMQTQVKKKIFAVIIEAEEQLSCHHEDNSNVISQSADVFDYSTPNIKCEVFTEDSNSDYITD